MEVNTGLQLKEKAFEKHQVSFTVEEIAILHSAWPKNTQIADIK